MSNTAPPSSTYFVRFQDKKSSTVRAFMAPNEDRAKDARKKFLADAALAKLNDPDNAAEWEFLDCFRFDPVKYDLPE